MFFLYTQNNSGGSFSFKQDKISHYVIIEADSAKEAEEKALALGIYFDGCSTGQDCECCGDRWYRVPDESETPMIYDEDVSEGISNDRAWMGNKPEGFIHYKNGKVVPILVKSDAGDIDAANEKVTQEQLKRITGIVERYVTEDGSNTSSAVRDIMIELQHYCRENKIDFYERFHRAEEGYQEELDEACLESESEFE